MLEHRVGERREVEVVAEQLLGRHRLGDLHQRAASGRTPGPAGSAAPARRELRRPSSAFASGVVAERGSSSRQRSPHERHDVGWLTTLVPDGSKKSRYQSIVRREALVERERRRPAELARAPARRDRYWWRISLLASLRTSGSSFDPISCEDPLDELEHGDLHLVREVERLPCSVGSAAELLGEQHVRDRAVLDVEVVAHERAVGADDRALAAEHATGSCPARCGSS